MRNLASVQKIKDLTPIQDADRIELAHVLGWQCVVQKGKFHAGDPCVYFEVDSFLPLKPEFEFLRSSSYHRSDLLGEGFRLKTMKFRGEISQGLVMPVAEVLTEEQIDSLRDASGNIPDGTDVTDMLGVRKCLKWQQDRGQLSDPPTDSFRLRMKPGFSRIRKFSRNLPGWIITLLRSLTGQVTPLWSMRTMSSTCSVIITS